MTTASPYSPQDLAQLATYIKGRHEETLGSTRNALTTAMAAGCRSVPNDQAAWRHWPAVGTGRAAAAEAAALRGPKVPEAPKGPRLAKHKVIS
jgi:hypothetical protein